MVELDPAITVAGPQGPVTLLETFEGRRQLIACYHMWFPGNPASEQCEGCTFYNGQVRELSYLHAREVTYATFCYGPYAESVRYRDFMGWDVPWYAVQDSAERLLAGGARRAGRTHPPGGRNTSSPARCSAPTGGPPPRCRASRPQPASIMIRSKKPVSVS
jgi:hypothetical protein